MEPEERGGLGPAMTTFIVVDVILVITFLVLVVLLRPFDSAPEAAATATSSSPAPETTPEESAPEAPTDAAEITAFQLPSGNIWCEMTANSATCTILRFTFSPPDVPAGCDGTVGNVLTVTAGQDPEMACVVGEPPPVPADAPVLEYGEASTVGEMTCHSSTNGATCRHNPTGSGFSVARAGFRFF